MKVKRRYYVGAALARAAATAMPLVVGLSFARMTEAFSWGMVVILVIISTFGVFLYGTLEHSTMAKGRKDRRERIHSEMRKKRYHEQLERQWRVHFL